MRGFTSLALTAVAAICFISGSPKSEAQITVNIGAAPACPYGYYDYAPYNCAPNSYYGPEWFTGGVFVGAGPWFHGSKDFHGQVDNHYDQQQGYKGPVPSRGEKAEPTKAVNSANFKGNEDRDGRGHPQPATNNKQK